MTAPDDDRPPGPVLSPAFWTVLIFGLFCILAGVGVATLGPKLFHKSPPIVAAPAKPD